MMRAEAIPVTKKVTGVGKERTASWFETRLRRSSP